MFPIGNIRRRDGAKILIVLDCQIQHGHSWNKSSDIIDGGGSHSGPLLKNQARL